MANPQKENGHLDLANEIVKQLAKLKLSGSEWQILWVVWEKTYGWHKLEDCISLSQFEKETGLTRQGICKSIKKLVNKRLLLVNKHTLANRYKFNKDYEKWVVNKRLPSKQIDNQLVNKTTIASKQKDTYKRNYTKETNTKERIHIGKIGKNTCPEATELINYYKEIYGYKATIPKQLENWRAAKWLFMQYGLDKTKLAIMAGKQALEDSISGIQKVPLIKNLLDLKEKYEQLRAYYGRKKSRDNTTVNVE